MESHLLQMRGLKLSKMLLSLVRALSHLLQMRGLKHRDAAVFKLQQESHLLQMRGLKQVRHRIKRGSRSRIFYRCVD